MRKKILAIMMVPVLALCSTAMPVCAAGGETSSVRQIGDSEQQADDSERQIDHLEQQTDDSGQQTDHLEQQTDDSERQTGDSEQQADASERQADDSERQADDSERQTDDSERQTDDSERQIDDSVQQADDSERQIDDSVQQADDLEQQIDDLVQQADDSEQQEEPLVGRGFTADVRECGDAEAFADALADINLEYPCDFDGEIILDLQEGVVTDQDGEELVGSDSGVATALRENDPEDAALILEENGYSNVCVEDGIVRADDRYDTGRLFVTSSEPVDTRGALSVISFGETCLIQYTDSAEAAAAAEELRDDPGVREVIPDFVIRYGADEMTERAAEETDHTDSIAEYDCETTEEAAAEADAGEELVGRFFTGSSTYRSAAVSYMGIDKFLSNVGTNNDVVRVAVLDTGYDTSCSYVDYSRILLKEAVVLAGSGLTDEKGHGTFVLNQIYEATDSAVRFIPVKMSGKGKEAFTSSILLSAIYAAVNAGADFINLSSGGDMKYYETFEAGENALQYALDNNCYLITSAGNDGRSVNYVWPAKSSRCITVSAISHINGGFAGYSNYGDAVDFAAPGGDEIAPILGYTRGNVLVGMAGTSMAVPYYTAILANLKANGRSYSSLSGLIKSLAGYCEGSLTAYASEKLVGNGCVYLPNAINRTITTKAFNAIGERTYTGSAVRPNPKVTYGGKALREGRDYVLSYSNNVNTGTAVITVSGRGLCHGSASREFMIVPRSLAGAAVSTKYRTYEYTGNARRPGVTVTLNGKTLVKDQDYSVSYKDNINPGLAAITVTGIGNYTGTAGCRFGLSKRVTDVTAGFAYVLVPKLAAGRAVALKDGKTADNSALMVGTKTCSEAQQYRIAANADGTYSFINMKCELALDSYNGNAASGAAAVIRNYRTTLDSEKWNLQKNSDGTFLIINKNSGKVLAAENNAADHSALTMHTKSGSAAQRFYFEQVSDAAVSRPYKGYCALGSYVNTSYVMDVPAAVKTSGAVLQIYKSNGSAAQQFRLLYSGDGTYRIENRNSGKVLMPTRSKAVPGAAVVQGVWSGATCQKWRVVEKNDGAIMLRNCAGYYLEMSGNTAKNEVKLRLNDYASARRMMWVRLPVGR